MAGFSAALLATGILTAGGVASEVEAGGVAGRINELGPSVESQKWGVDPSFLLADEAAGLIVNGGYIRNPTAQNLVELIGDSGKIRVGGYLGSGPVNLLAIVRKF